MAGSKSKQVKYEALVKKVLIALRGKRTQKEMSAHIGYKFNQWHKWEAGQKKLMWNDLVATAEFLKIQFPTTLSHILGTEIKNLKDGRRVLNALNSKFGRFDHDALKDQLGIPKAKLTRILKGDQQIEAYLIFTFLGEVTDALPTLVEILTPDMNDPQQKDAIKKMSVQRNLEAEFPWLAAIEAILEHRDYKKLSKHDPQFFVDKLGISAAVIEKSIALLEKNGAVELVNNKYQLNQKRVDMEGPTLMESAKLAKFWTKMALERFNTLDGVPASGKGWTYRIFACSREAQLKIKYKMIEFYGDVHKILLDDGLDNIELAQVVMVHFFDNEEFSEIESFKKMSVFEK